ncbi:MAG: hypothetical protein FJX64_01605 [Alphaproteobacteria bacterium]|nr:hypothetical protein [Alphaproteobacteria bacterium]
MAQFIIRPAAELGTKSRYTRAHFQNALRRNIALALRRAGASRALVQDFGRIYLDTDSPTAAARVLSRVFGIGNFSAVEAECTPDLDTIVATAVRVFGERVRGRRFAVRAKRVRAVGLCHPSGERTRGGRVEGRGRHRRP